jgi:hypothetical protein
MCMKSRKTHQLGRRGNWWRNTAVSPRRRHPPADAPTRPLHLEYVKKLCLEEADPSCFDDGFATHHQETLPGTSQLPPCGPLDADEPDLLGDRVRSAGEGERGEWGRGRPREESSPGGEKRGRGRSCYYWTGALLLYFRPINIRRHSEGSTT